MSERFARVAESYVGTPFVMHGRSPGRALDCVGVVVCAMRELGLDPEDWLGYGDRPREADLVDHFDRSPLVERVSEPYQAGDILALRWPRAVRHVAVLCADGSVVRADAKRGVVKTAPAWNRAQVVYRITENGMNG